MKIINKKLVESLYPPLNHNGVLWVDKDESSGDWKSIKEYHEGKGWEDLIASTGTSSNNLVLEFDLENPSSLFEEDFKNRGYELLQTLLDIKEENRNIFLDYKYLSYTDGRSKVETSCKNAEELSTTLIHEVTSSINSYYNMQLLEGAVSFDNIRLLLYSQMMLFSIFSSPSIGPQGPENITSKIYPYVIYGVCVPEYTSNTGHSNTVYAVVAMMKIKVGEHDDSVDFILPVPLTDKIKEILNK